MRESRAAAYSITSSVIASSPGNLGQKAEIPLPIVPLFAFAFAQLYWAAKQ